MEPSLGSEVEDVGAEGVGVVGTPPAVQLGDLSERLCAFALARRPSLTEPVGPNELIAATSAALPSRIGDRNRFGNRKRDQLNERYSAFDRDAQPLRTTAQRVTAASPFVGELQHHVDDLVQGQPCPRRPPGGCDPHALARRAGSCASSPSAAPSRHTVVSGSHRHAEKHEAGGDAFFGLEQDRH